MNGLTPDITAAEVVRHGVLRLTFADGLSGEVEVLGRGGADLAPDTLYERVQSGAWPEPRTAA